MKSVSGEKRVALKEEECEKIFSYGDQLNWSSGYVDLGDYPDGSDLKAGVEAPGTWKTLTQGAELEVVVMTLERAWSDELTDPDELPCAIELKPRDDCVAPEERTCPDEASRTEERSSPEDVCSPEL